MFSIYGSLHSQVKNSCYFTDDHQNLRYISNTKKHCQEINKEETSSMPFIVGLWFGAAYLCFTK